MRKRPLNLIPASTRSSRPDESAAFTALVELHGTMMATVVGRGIAPLLDRAEQELLRLGEHVLAISEAGLMAHRWYGHFEHAYRHCHRLRELLPGFRHAEVVTAPQLKRMLTLVDDVSDGLSAEWRDVEMPPKLRSALERLGPPSTAG
jgi:hypothetical protein